MYLRITAVFLLVSVTFAGQFPFPQNKTYRYGISTSSIDSAAIQSIYREWKHNFYTQKDSVARIKWDDPYESVSEGIASIKIFDLKGRECASQNFTSKTGPKTVSLNTFNLLDNIYFVKINGNWKSHTIKVPLFRYADLKYVSRVRTLTRIEALPNVSVYE